MAKAQEHKESQEAQGYTFGIEIECLLPSRALEEYGIYRGRYHEGEPLPYPFPAGWNCQSDSSISSPNEFTLVPVEIVSGVLQGVEGLREVQEVCRLLNSMGAKVNRSCGLHVHVGIESVAKENTGEMAEFVGRLLHFVAHYELGLTAFSGTLNRMDNQYATQIKNDSSSKGIAEKIKKEERKDLVIYDNWMPSRYHSVNVSNALTGRNTVEFRIFSGSTSYIKIAGWIQLCLGVCEKAKELRGWKSWDMNENLKTREAGKPYDVALALLYHLGWSKGTIDKGKDEVRARGYIQPIDGIKRTKNELLRLARKFNKEWEKDRAENEWYR